jgi:hypothetical protein
MKEHRGVSAFRDFLLLVAPGAVRKAEPDLTALLAASERVSGTAHPAVLALYPVLAGSPLPRFTRPTSDVGVLEVRSGGLSFGLLIEGREIAPEHRNPQNLKPETRTPSDQSS